MTLLRHCYPEDLFSESARLAEASWTCVRVRPRWEKKFARWLTGQGMSYFLPLNIHRTVSHRKVRQTEVPLFPGYVFVSGILSKQVFAASGCVVRVLHPRSAQEGVRLSVELEDLHRMLVSGVPVILEHMWTPGQRVKVLDGPLFGIVGTVVRDGGEGRLSVWIEMLGVGTAVTLPPGTALEAAET